MDEQLLEIFQKLFDKELYLHNIILSRPEKVRLFRQAAKSVLTDMLVKIDDKNEG